MLWSSLPPELLDNVLNHDALASLDFARAALVCRAWRFSATRRLYRHLDIMADSVSLGSIKKLASTLRKRADYRSFVWSVSVCHFRPSSVTPLDASRLIALCNPRELEIRHEYLYMLVDVLPHTISQLTRLFIWVPFEDQMFLDALSHFPHCPALRSLAVQVDHFERNWTAVGPFDSTPNYQLQHLELDSASEFATDLIQLFTGSRSQSVLKALELSLRCSVGERSPEGLVAVEHLHGLEMLKLSYKHTSMEYILDSATDVTFAAGAQLAPLSKATRLQRVSLSLACGFDPASSDLTTATMHRIARGYDACLLWEHFPLSVDTISIEGAVSTLVASKILSGERLKHLKALTICHYTADAERKEVERHQLEQLALEKGVRLKISDSCIRVWD